MNDNKELEKIIRQLTKELDQKNEIIDSLRLELQLKNETLKDVENTLKDSLINIKDYEEQLKKSINNYNNSKFRYDKMSDELSKMLKQFKRDKNSFKPYKLRRI